MSYDTSIDQNTSVHSRIISAFFDTSGAAKKAVDDLVAAGIPREHITQTGGQGAAGAVSTTATPGEDKGFWDSLKDLFLPDDDRYAYAEGLRRGGYLISVRADEANYNKALDILDNDGAVNLDERESQWRSEGWTGSAGATALSGAAVGTAGTAAGLVSTTGTTSASRAVGSSAAGTASALTGSASNYEADMAARAAALGTLTSTERVTQERGTASLASGRDEVIPVYEEQLRVGKRDVSHGRVRLRSYVVETPVSEQVSLHSETVSIDRRPVDRPVSATDALFQDRVIEADERVEEAVVSKEARVKEEITLRKSAEDRVETVSDSVRSTKVDVEDTRNAGTAGRVAAFSAGADASRIVEHMDVVAADGQKIGTVDHLDGPDRIKLAKNTSPDGQHHHVPFAWIDHVDQHVHLKKTLAEIKADTSTTW